MGDFAAELDAVVGVMRGVRVPAVRFERDLQVTIGRALVAAGIAFDAEVVLGRGCRVDFLTAGGVAVELKKGKPNRRQVMEQVDRYLACEQVRGLVVVCEGREVLGRLALRKPVRCVCLAMNHGVALP